MKADDPPAGTVRVIGTVHFYPIEGGFWAVHGDEGVTYDPLSGFPASFQQENLRVTMIVRIRTDVASVHMVGPLVDVIQIQRL